MIETRVFRLIPLLLALATPAVAVRPQAETPPPAPVLGITYYPAEIAEFGGIRIAQLMPGFPAERAGLRVGDVVVAVDGEPPSAEGDPFGLRQSRADDRPLKFEVVRDGRRLALPVRLSDRAPASRPTGAYMVLRATSPAPPVESRPADLERAESLVAEARALIAAERPSGADLERARALLAESARRLALFRASVPPRPSPAAVMRRAEELQRAGRTFEEIEAELLQEFGFKIEIRGVATRRPSAEAGAAESRPSSRPSSRPVR
jgi:hypothetical protein